MISPVRCWCWVRCWASQVAGPRNERAGPVLGFAGSGLLAGIGIGIKLYVGDLYTGI